MDTREATNITLPPSALFPITITAILAPAGVTVSRHTPILRYKYWHEVEEGDEDDEGAENKQKVKREFHTTFECPFDGKIEQWYVSVGDELSEQSMYVGSILEPCTHSVQYGGLCAICGATLDQEDYTEFDNKDRAPISMAHDTSGLKVSYDEAQRIEKTSSDRLLKEEKLILVVDLDQTVIHAAVDPTIGEWMRDTSNPNHEALKDVQYFSLEEKLMPHPSSGANFAPTMTTCWYYVKVRPGLQNFLESMSKMYEMHVYTMATKSYAKAIANIIDPDGKFFGDRILSRDESGSLVQKSLKRLFPVTTSMVAIIDDRGDVWKWSANLVKVIPYNFFVGIGDINSSFLPQRSGIIEPQKDASGSSETTSVNPSELSTKEKTHENSTATDEGNTESNSHVEPSENVKSPVDQLVQIAGGEDNPDLLKAQADERIEVLEQQQADRPLAKLQKDLEESSDEEKSDREDTSDEVATTATTATTNNENENNNNNNDSTDNNQRHLLVDNDKELSKLEAALTKIHDEYYKEYYKNLSKNIKTEPDTNEIIPKIKKQVFKGCVFLFSGILPLGTNLDSADIVQWVKSFGAVVVADFVDTVTHVIATSNKTKKVKQAAFYPNIHIVYTDWIFACISDWKRVPEDKYQIEVEKDETLFNGGGGAGAEEAGGEEGEDGDYNLEISDDEGNEANDEMDAETFMKSLNQGDVDWDEIDKEVEDFMASSDDDDDDDDDDGGNDDDDDNDDDEKMDGENASNARKRLISNDADDDESINKRAKFDNDTAASSEAEGYDEDELVKELENDLI